MAVQMGQYNVPVPALPEQEGLPDVRNRMIRTGADIFIIFR